MQCDMCGKQAEPSELFYTSIEGTMLKACSNCSRYGKVMKAVKSKTLQQKQKKILTKPLKQEPLIEEMVVGNFAEIVKNAREKKSIKQEDFARLINEKESLIHNIETDHMKPSIKLAKKLEHFLSVKLIQEVELNTDLNQTSSKKADNLTIGDIIKFKKSKS